MDFSVEVKRWNKAFQPKVMDQLILASGGEPRQLMHLFRQAVNYGGLPITKTAADQSLVCARKTRGRPMSAEDWKIVEQVALSVILTREAASEDRVYGLLINRQVLKVFQLADYFPQSPNRSLGSSHIWNVSGQGIQKIGVY